MSIYRMVFFILVTMLSFAFVSGCSDAPEEHTPADANVPSNITSGFRELPEVQYFLIMHPDANITHLSIDGTDAADLELEEIPGISYLASIKNKNRSITAQYDEMGKLLGMSFENPQFMDDTSERLFFDQNLSFNIIKNDSNIYVTFTGGIDEVKVDYFVINGQNALGRQFTPRVLGDEDGSKDNILYRAAKLEGACSTCWLNFVEITAVYMEGDRITVLQAQI